MSMNLSINMMHSIKLTTHNSQHVGFLHNWRHCAWLMKSKYNTQLTPAANYLKRERQSIRGNVLDSFVANLLKLNYCVQSAVLLIHTLTVAACPFL